MRNSSRHRPPWTTRERNILRRLSTPEKIQAYLDGIAYSGESRYRSPRSVMRERRGHCFDGAVFAAAALRHHGERARLVDIQAVRDDDHVLAIYRRHNCYGAVAKSNFAGLRFREPIYRTIRELALSYFEYYFNMNREKSMRQYTVPLDLSRFDALSWETDDAAMDAIGDKLSEIRVTPIITPRMTRGLRRVDRRLYRSGLLGANLKGVYRP